LDSNPNSPTYLPIVRDNRFSRALVLPDRIDFAPRLGVAWTPGWAHEKTACVAVLASLFASGLRIHWFDLSRNVPMQHV